MNKHQRIDDAICERIALVPGGVHPMYNPRIIAICREEGYKADRGHYWRLIDRRMQSMRKAGRIVFDGKPKRWRVA